MRITSHGSKLRINISAIETAQDLNKSLFKNTELIGIFSGHAFTGDSIKILSKPLNEIEMALIKVLEAYLPIPLTNIMIWKDRVFKESSGLER